MQRVLKKLAKVWGTVAQQVQTVAQQVQTVGFVGQGTAKLTSSLPPSNQRELQRHPEKPKVRSNMIAYHLHEQACAAYQNLFYYDMSCTIQANPLFVTGVHSPTRELKSPAIGANDGCYSWKCMDTTTKNG